MLKYILHESYPGNGHNGSAILYQFIKRQYYWKGLKKTTQALVSHCLQAVNMQDPNYYQQHFKILKMVMDFIAMDVIYPFE